MGFIQTNITRHYSPTLFHEYGRDSLTDTHLID